MATTRTNSAATATSTSALTPEVRRKLKSIVLELRHLLEDDFHRQLVAVSVTEDGVKPLATGRALSDEQQRVRDTAVAMLKREVAGGAAQAEAYATLLRESVYTFLNRAIGLRCLEARGLFLVDGQTETAISQQEELGGISSLYWRVRNTLGGPSQPREIWRETYRRACAVVSRAIRVLFDPQAEYAALFPLQPAMQRVVEALNDPAIPPDAYTEDAVLGWVYQYFQSEEKDRIFAGVRTKKKKIGGADIIPVTQLYTEQYMVDFLLQNSLGRTWMEMYPDSPAKAAWPYYVEPATPHFRPHKPLREWTILDPCVGSGHFLVVAFDLLAQLYAEERRMGESGVIPLAETVVPADVPLTILEHNLYGIDIDRRAAQLTTLALYLKARATGLSRSPRVNIVAADASYLQGEAWERFLAGFQKEPSMRRVLAAMAGYLKDIRELGSLLRPEEELKRLIAEEHKRWQEAGRPRQAGLFPEYESPRQERLAFEQKDDSDEMFWEQLSYRADAAIQAFYDSARASGDLDEQIVAGEAQRGFAFLELCQRRYDVVCTNPPYMGSANMARHVKEFVAKRYPSGKRDLFACFILRCYDLCTFEGYVGMVTQQAWMFLRSFSDLRAVPVDQANRTNRGFLGLLRSTSIEVLAHLGASAFAEISGEVVNIVLFTFRKHVPAPSQSVMGLRLTAPRAPEGKASAIMSAVSTGEESYICRQLDLLSIDRAPLVYWLSPGFSELLRSLSPLGERTYIRQGICTTDNVQFVRALWEVPRSSIGERWFLFAKGGGTTRWSGFDQWVVDWENDGLRVKTYQEQTPGAIHWSGRMPDRSYFFRHGWTFSLVARGTLAARELPTNALFCNTSPAAIPYDETDMPIIGFWLNCRLATYLLRALTQNLYCREGYVQRLPLPNTLGAEQADRLNSFPMALRRWLNHNDPTELLFDDLRPPQKLDEVGVGRIEALYLAGEGLRERVSVVSVNLSQPEIAEMCGETGTPAGWHSLIAGYDALPELPAGLPPVPQELIDFLAHHEQVALPPEHLVRLKGRLRALYVAGSGAKVRDDNPTPTVNGEAGDNREDIGEEDEEGIMATGARIPIPAETFLEELSQKLEVHPISVYWLLKEMRRDEGLVCPPEMRRQMEDYASVTLLRELGFRWPEQDISEAKHGPILDPALVVEDGILPLMDCGTGAAAALQIRLRLERDFGEEGADESEAEFRKWVGRPLEDWLHRDFFKRHIQQFKQRPIAWHFVSPGKTFEAFVLYHKLCDESTGRETLQRLRTQYAGGLITRLRAEQDRAKVAKDDHEVTRLQLAMEDVEEFRERLEQIERGDNLKARICCRWKGDEAREGRPGPYSPDINDGVKVNVRPFQELSLLSTPVIKKWD